MWQIAPEDLTSAGNQDKIRELQVEDQIEDAEQEEEVQEAMERGLEAESHEVFIVAVLTWGLSLSPDGDPGGRLHQLVLCELAVTLLLAGLLAGLLACLHACLPACLLACWQNVLGMCSLQAYHVTL